MSEERELTQEEKDRIEDYRVVFGSDEGKRVLEDMGFKYNGPSLLADTSMGMAYLVGQRDVFYDIKAMAEFKEKPLKEEEVET